VNRPIYSSQVLVTANNLLLSLIALICLEKDNFRIWFIASQTFFIAQTFLRSAFFEPANFSKKSMRVNFPKVILIYIYFFATFYIANKYSLSLSTANIYLISASLSISILQDFYRYKKIPTSPKKVFFADAIVFASTIFLIALVATNDAVVFILIFIAFPNLISILYMKFFAVENTNETQEFKLRSEPIYTFSSLLELALYQLMTILITIYFSSLELQSLRTLVLIVAPLTSIRLFLWSESIIEIKKVGLTTNQKQSKRRREILVYIMVALFTLVGSYSVPMKFLYLPDKYISFIFIVATLLALIFVEKAVIIRQRASKPVIVYFASAFPFVSFFYLVAFRNESSLNQLVTCQFAITLLNLIFALWYIRVRIREN